MDPAAPVTSTTLPSSAGADLAFFQAYGHAAQEVFDGDVADLGGEGRACDDLRHRRHGAEADAELPDRAATPASSHCRSADGSAIRTN
jgi:hypothetical protein